MTSRLSKLEGEHKKEMSLYSIGKSTQGRDIYAVDLYAGTGTPEETIYIAAGHHGTEGGGVEAAVEFIEGYLASGTPFAQRLKEKVRITIVPCVNVDQYALPYTERKYNNPNGIDLNSQYNRRQGVPLETKAVKSHYLSFKEPINLAFDLHETQGEWVKGFSVYENKPYRRRVLDHAAHATKAVEKAGYPLHDPTIIHDLNANCFDGFACENNAYSYTFEAPLSSKFSLEDRVEISLVALDDVIYQYYKDRV